MVTRTGDDLPPALAGNADAAAFYGLVRRFISRHIPEGAAIASVAADTALVVSEIFRRNRKVGYWDDLDAQRQTMNDIDDYLYDEVKGTRAIPLAPAEMDEIIDQAMALARHRTAQ